MNEQQLADLFSEKLDLALDGEAVVLPEGAGEVAELLDLGQQVSEFNFQASSAAQAAFQSQLAAWTGAASGGASAMALGISKIALIGLITAAVIGAGIGLVTLFRPERTDITPNETGPAIERTELPASLTPSVNEMYKSNSPVATPTLAPQATTSPLQTPIPPVSTGDTIPEGASSLSDTLTLPAPSPAPTVEEATPAPAVDSSDSGAGPDDPEEAGQPGKPDEHDRGHGNDPDGFDEDNPGKSSGASGGGKGGNKGGKGGKRGK